MHEYNKLRELIGSLSSFEMKFIKKNFRQYYSNDSDSTLVLLFNHIIKQEVLEYDELIVKIYGFENKIAFKKLAQRLLEKFLDILISKDMLLNENNYTIRNRELFSIKRKFLYYDILSVHGLNQQALFTLNQIIKYAKEFEFYDHLLIALNFKLVRLSRRSTIDKLTYLQQEILFFNRCNLATNKANYLLAHYSSMKNSGLKLDSINFVSKEIKYLESEYEFSKSNRIKTSLYYLQGILLSNSNKFIEAKENFYQFYKHLKTISIRLSKRNDILNCLLNICEFEMKTFEFNKALEVFKEVDKLKIVNQFNLEIIYEMKFLCFVSIGEIEKAREYLNLMKKDIDTYDVSVLHNDRMAYYHAVFAFLDGKNKYCLDILRDINIIDKKLPDWNVGLRVLTIMSYINSEKFSLADNAIENFRKYYDKNHHLLSQSGQIKGIFKILSILSKFGYDFKRTNMESEHFLGKFVVQSNMKYFDYRSPFLIPFTPWFKSKLKNVPYDHSAAMREMRKRFKAEQLEMA